MNIIFSILTGILVLIIILATIFLLFILLGTTVESIRKKLLKRVEDDELGPYFFRKDNAEGNLKIFGKPLIPVTFPVKNGKIEPEIRSILKELANFSTELKNEIAGPAIKDFKEIFPDPTVEEDEGFKEIIEAAANLIDEPVAFLENFEIVRCEISEESQQIQLEFLPPWDPEHTVSAILNYKLRLVDYRLTCAL